MQSPVMIFLKRFSAVFILSAFLPIGLFLVLSPQNYDLFSRAERNLELRLWFEPRSLIIKPQQPIKIKLVGEFMDETAIIGGLNVKLQSDIFQLTPAEIVYTKPFRGRLVLAEITLTATQTGEFSLEILQENVRINSKDSVSLVTGSTTVAVRD